MADFLNDAQCLTLIARTTSGYSISELRAWLTECEAKNDNRMLPPTPAEWYLWQEFKIDAIKAYRNRVPGSGLKDTKDLFEAGRKD